MRSGLPLLLVLAAIPLAGCLPSFDEALLCEDADDGLLCGASEAGTCRAGICCGGCWDGSACLEGTSVSACGVGGAFCNACADSEFCQRGACLPELAVATVAAGRDTTCAIDERSVLWCWGSNESGATGHGGSGIARVAPDARWIDVDLGHAWRTHGCAIREDGELHCWGGSDGWAPRQPSSSEPVRVESPGLRWTDIATGTNFSCGVRAPGTLWCWGSGNDGRLGYPRTLADDRGVQTVPRQVASDEDWRAVDLGEAFGCALRRGDQGILECWGSNSHGQRGHAEEGPAPVGEGFTAFAAGVTHACGVADGRLLCWGDNADGKAGQPPDVTTVPTPTRVGDQDGWEAVTAGETHSCATRDGGQLYCWGSNSHGQLGLGVAPSERPSSASPMAVASDDEWAQLAAGQRHTCGLTASGTLYCWGSNSLRQAGDTADYMPEVAPFLVQLE